MTLHPCFWCSISQAAYIVAVQVHNDEGFNNPWDVLARRQIILSMQLACIMLMPAKLLAAAISSGTLGWVAQSYV